MSVFFIAEIGINHNGDLAIAKKLISEAKLAGCDAVKLQKRTIDVVYSKEELDKFRESPWGTTNREQKMGLEFGEKEFDEIDRYCKELNIQWTASTWDIYSQRFLQKYNVTFNKVASPMLTHLELLEIIAKEGKKTFISTGMSGYPEIDAAVAIFKKHNCPFELMHCVSTYPMNDADANLNVIHTLRNHYKCDVGYSSHEVGICISLAAVAMGATSLERHITLDRAMYGSDQSASLEIPGLVRLIRDCRSIESALGNGKKELLEIEVGNMKKLRKDHWETEKG